MSKQRPRIDDRWDRRPTGLIVPRRPGLPTRRFINPLGSPSCECCGCNTGCVTFTISGMTSGTCSTLNCSYDKTVVFRLIDGAYEVFSASIAPCGTTIEGSLALNGSYYDLTIDDGAFTILATDFDACIDNITVTSWPTWGCTFTNATISLTETTTACRSCADVDCDFPLEWDATVSGWGAGDPYDACATECTDVECANINGNFTLVWGLYETLYVTWGPVYGWGYEGVSDCNSLAFGHLITFGCVGNKINVNFRTSIFGLGMCASWWYGSASNGAYPTAPDTDCFDDLYAAPDYDHIGFRQTSISGGECYPYSVSASAEPIWV